MGTTNLMPLTWEEMKAELKNVKKSKPLVKNYKHISISEKEVLDMTGIDGGNKIQKPAASFTLELISN